MNGLMALDATRIGRQKMRQRGDLIKSLGSVRTASPEGLRNKPFANEKSDDSSNDKQYQQQLEMSRVANNGERFTHDTVLRGVFSRRSSRCPRRTTSPMVGEALSVGSTRRPAS
jgi:hypothetical protein